MTCILAVPSASLHFRNPFHPLRRWVERESLPFLQHHTLPWEGADSEGKEQTAQGKVRTVRGRSRQRRGR
eukprot:3784836-Rhodomonas_salina.1